MSLKKQFSNPSLKMPLLFVLAAFMVSPFSLFASSAKLVTISLKKVILLTAQGGQDPTARPYQNMLAAMGWQADRMEVGAMQPLALREAILIVPQVTAAVLTPQATAMLLTLVSEGMGLVTEGESSLTHGLPLTFSNGKFQVDSITDLLHPQVKIRWKQKVMVQKISQSAGMIFCRAAQSGIPVFCAGILGKGRFLYLAVPLAPAGGFGFERFPYFHEAFKQWFACQPPFERSALSAYMDWEYHREDNPEELAIKIKAQGISDIHLSAWNDLAECGDFYSRFIHSCHGQGIRVYAWLELPMVSEKFWDEHPAWREKTADGSQAHVDWRLLMALEDPACMQAVKTELRRMLRAFAWDGIDVAELYFESPLGAEQPAVFTPMGDYFRSQYKSHFGVDPREFFDPASANFHKNNNLAFRNFLQFRTRLCLQLNREIIGFLQKERCQPFNQAPDLVLTLIDCVLDQGMSKAIGIDTESFLNWQRQEGFALQVEDPYTLWALGPERYSRMASAYCNRLRPGTRLSFDINVVDRADTAFPHPRQTGLEFLALIHEADRVSDQACIYAVNTPYSFDYPFVPAALTGKVHMDKTSPTCLTITSPQTVIFRFPISGRRFLVNGRDWPAVHASGVLLPAGTSRLECLDGENGTGPRLTDINGSLRDCRLTERGIRVSYDDSRTVFLTFNFQPLALTIDGRQANLPVYPSSISWTIGCPAGHHVLTVDSKQ